MDNKFRVEQLPDSLSRQAENVSTAADAKALSAAQESLAQLLIHLYKVTPMGEQQPGEQIERLSTMATLRRGSKPFETPIGKRSIAIILEDLENGSVALQMEGTPGGLAEAKRHRCQRNTIFILNEKVVIGIPKDGEPETGDQYPDSIKMLLVKVGYVQK